MSKLTKTEIGFMIAAALALIFALGLRFWSAGRAVPVEISTGGNAAVYLSEPAGTDVPERGLIDINSADAELFAMLPGIGEALAERIIAHRAEHGAFTEIEGLMDVPGIGEAKFEALKDLIKAEVSP